MRRIFFVIAILLVTGCVASTQSEKSQEQKCQEAIEVAETSLVTDSVLFLGFEFGMSPKEVMRHLNKLAKDGKVHADKGTGRYTYNLNTESGAVITVGFSPKYRNEELYHMRYNLYNSFLGTKLATLMTYNMFSSANREKGNQTLNFIYNDILGNEQIYSIKNNLVVHFDTALGCMSYFNAPDSLKQKNAQQERANQAMAEF